MVSFTDGLWSVLPMVYGQFYRWFMVSLNFEFPANRGKTDCAEGLLCMYVCLFNTVNVVYREGVEKW
jgi:hypothetical protein